MEREEERARFLKELRFLNLNPTIDISFDKYF